MSLYHIFVFVFIAVHSVSIERSTKDSIYIRLLFHGKENTFSYYFDTISLLFKTLFHEKKSINKMLVFALFPFNRNRSNAHHLSQFVYSWDIAFGTILTFECHIICDSKADT